MRQYPSYKITKELIHRFQETQDKGLLDRIYKRMDLLILSTIQKERRKNTKYYHVEIEDMYQVAICGAKKAIDTMSIHEEFIYVPARFVGYIKSELKIYYKDRPDKGYGGAYDEDTYAEEPYIESEEAYREVNGRLDMDRVVKVLGELFRVDKLSMLDIVIFRKRYMEEKDYRIIGEELGYSHQWVMEKLIYIDDTIEKNMENILDLCEL